MNYRLLPEPVLIDPCPFIYLNIESIPYYE